MEIYLINAMELFNFIFKLYFTKNHCFDIYTKHAIIGISFFSIFTSLK